MRRRFPPRMSEDRIPRIRTKGLVQKTFGNVQTFEIYVYLRIVCCALF
jgi:hypothetical protein